VDEGTTDTLGARDDGDRVAGDVEFDVDGGTLEAARTPTTAAAKVDELSGHTTGRYGQMLFALQLEGHKLALISLCAQYTRHVGSRVVLMPHGAGGEVAGVCRFFTMTDLVALNRSDGPGAGGETAATGSCLLRTMIGLVAFMRCSIPGVLFCITIGLLALVMLDTDGMAGGL
jgi:hypothetical protein